MTVNPCFAAVITVILLWGRPMANFQGSQRTGVVYTPSIERPDFTGRWELNRTESDNVPDRIAEFVRTARPTEIRKRNKTKSIDRRYRIVTAAWEWALSALSLPETLMIWHDTDRLVLGGVGGAPRVFHSHGLPDETESERASGISVVTRWNDDLLTTEMKMPESRKVFLSYELAKGGFQMIVTMRLEPALGSQPILIRSVYDWSRMQSLDFMSPPQ